MQSPQFDHNTGLFHNSDGSANKKSASEMFGLVKAMWKREQDPNEKTGFPVLNPEMQKDSQIGRQALWIGHSTLMVSIDGINLLTDPVFSERASPFSFAGPKRVTALPLTIPELPKIDVVLISHNHYDHLSLPSLKALYNAQPEIHYFVPLGLAEIIRSAGISRVTELDWWQTIQHGKLEITSTAVRHWSSRKGFDRNRTLWSGWWVNWPDFSFYFAGDTGYSDDFKQTYARFGAPDLAAIPIGAYLPRPFMKDAHVNPDEAVQIFQDLQPKRAIAIHWGTFKLTSEPLAEPPARLKQALKAQKIPESRFRVLQHGQKWLFD